MRGGLLAPQGARAPSGAPMHVAEGYRVGGPFTMIDQDGANVNEASFAGRYRLIFFGYTFCPDTCPTELGNLAVAMDALAASDAQKAARVVPIFVTVDPARDTPEILQTYVAHFHPRLVGLTGNQEQVAAMAASYKVFSQLGEDDADDGRYLVDHSAFTYLMGPDGGFLAMFNHGFDPAGLADSVARIMDEHGL